MMYNHTYKTFCAHGVTDSTMVFGTSSQFSFFLHCLHQQKCNDLISIAPLPIRFLNLWGPQNHSLMVPLAQICFVILYSLCAHGVTDSTMVFGTISEGSSPSGRTMKESHF